MEILEIMQELGLSSQESLVYVSLLENGSCLASGLSKQTKINRSHVYQILESLIGKGFVSYTIKNSTKQFNPVLPEKLLELQKEREERLKQAMPSLNAIIKPTKNKQVVEILEGKEGIKTILNEILRDKNEWLAFGSSGKSVELLPYYADHWEKERQRLKIGLRGIVDTSKSGIKRGSELNKLKLTEIRFLPEREASPTSTWIYGDKTAIIVWSKENPFAMRIVGKEITNSFRNHFNFLWKLASKQIQA